jgi:glycosyltransferase involved in cell wall biosynthesis
MSAKKVMKVLAGTCLNRIRSHPVFVAATVKALKLTGLHQPARRLFKFIVRAQAGDIGHPRRVAYELEYLSPFARRIYAELKVAFAQCSFKSSSSFESASKARRPRLAYVSPLPPERTGIADYSVELLPELARFYEIDVIVDQEVLTDPWIRENCAIRDFDWLRIHALEYDRRLYHIGNSPFHRKMFEALSEFPGVVVLHDFFLSGVHRYLELYGIKRFSWARELYQSHGYGALIERFREPDGSDHVVSTYPCNFSVLEAAQGIIVHSDFSRRLAEKWYGDELAAAWVTIPHLRQPVPMPDRNQARAKCNLPPSAFVVCSFGILDPSKLNHRLLEAWLASELAKNTDCYLIFVGQNHGGNYGQSLVETIGKSAAAARIRITGWADTETFRNYLEAADIGVQLRGQTRGETSGTVLDCMNYGVPTIVNANGSMADLPADTVWKLDDHFSNEQLTAALEFLFRDPARRQELSANALNAIKSRHSPAACAEKYHSAIEQFHSGSKVGRSALINQLAARSDPPTSDLAIRKLAIEIAQNLPLPRPARQLLVDVSAISRTDLKTGIERVVRALILEWIGAPPPGTRVEPVYLSNEGGHWHYRYARRYTLGLYDCPPECLDDEPIDVQTGDQLIVADLTGRMLVDAAEAGIYRRLDELGIGIHVIVYDLLPLLSPESFPPGAAGPFEDWLKSVAMVADTATCISGAVEDDLKRWLQLHPPDRKGALKVGHFHLGADVSSSAPSRGLPANARQILDCLEKRPTFLVVSTVEPRKGYLQTIAAFDLLWKAGVDVNLVIVGKEGWKGLPDSSRRSIPETVELLRKHPEKDHRLLWLEGISDEFLEQVYAASTCLLAPSDAEGFGLSLIEAAQHGIPIIARDLPVFLEIAGPNAYYFKGKDPSSLADGIQSWLRQYSEDSYPRSANLHWQTWKQSAAQFLAGIAAGQK